MKKIILIFLLFQQFSVLSNNNSVNSKELGFICKTWGYLKYYHPNVRNGKVDWDAVLIKNLDKYLKKSVSLDQTLNELINQAGKIQIKTKQPQSQKINYKMLIDLTWLKSNLISTDINEKLIHYHDFFKKRRNHYAKASSTDILSFKNEKKYPINANSTVSEKLLVLYRYWNIIEYYWPNKHLLTEKWDSILQYYIIETLKPNSDIEMIMFGINNSLNDAHSIHFSSHNHQGYILGNYPIHIHFELINRRVFVDQIDNKDLIGEKKLQIGDEILSCNKGTIEEIYKKVEKYAPFSDEETINRLLGLELEGSFKKPLHFLIRRKGEEKKINILRYEYKAIQTSNLPKMLSEGISYFNVSQFPKFIFLKGTKKNIFSLLFSADTVILDLRKEEIPYSFKGAATKYLYEKKTNFNPLIPIKSTKPGYFSEEKEETFGNKHTKKFKGLLVLLVNERTRSIGEYTGLVLQGYSNTLTIGTRTWGSAGYAKSIDIIGRNVVSMFTISAQSKSSQFFTNLENIKNNELYDNSGLNLNYFVDYTKQDSIIWGKDFILESAIRYIRNKK